MRNFLNEKRTVRTFLIIIFFLIILFSLGVLYGNILGTKSCTETLFFSLKKVLNNEVRIDKLMEFLNRIK